MLSVNQLSCHRNHQALFDDLTFTLNKGKVLQIRGPNGAGKTSLLRLLAGLALPTAGNISWQGEAIQTLGADYRSQVLFLGATAAIKGHLTVVENIRLLSALKGEFNTKYLAEVLEILQLAKLKGQWANYLSSGQQRRVALAQLMLTSLPIWILDEPLTALDEAGKHWVTQQIQTHSKRGGITIVATHQPLGLMDNVQELVFE